MSFILDSIIFPHFLSQFIVEFDENLKLLSSQQ